MSYQPVKLDIQKTDENLTQNRLTRLTGKTDLILHIIKKNTLTGKIMCFV